jgi:putative heme iron utilization protein
MAENTEIRAVEIVRRIRDEQAAMLSGKSNDEIIAFFKEAGEATRLQAQSSQKRNKCDQPQVGQDC